ncbi:restriction endonuclease subunit S [Thiocapsa imhoffii]|uniref:restriction endonuclease subunit S n=1 Tax=Thiocapsa imhoffii TaxID=382777 RepID=UPI001906F1A2|nr:restriction endonuclease subunit S [Thiocapsa imhoffii]
MLDALFESPENTQLYLEPLIQKGAKNTIKIKNAKFLSGTFPLPTYEDEQQKIAACLSSLDALIAVQADKLAAPKPHEKGLMQQPFPSPEAVTA